MGDGDDAPSGEKPKRNMMVILILVVIVIIIFVVVGVVASRGRDDDDDDFLARDQFGNPIFPNNPNQPFVQDCNALNTALNSCLLGNTMITAQQAGDCSVCINQFSPGAASNCNLFSQEVCPAMEQDRNCLACGPCRAQALQYLQCGVQGGGTVTGTGCQLNCNIPGLQFGGGFGGSMGTPIMGIQPNIILILMSDLGFGDLATYGHPYAETPNLDRLAREGTSFMNFHTSGNTPAASLPGFLTSRNPSWFPNYTADYGFLGTQTVMELMSRAGYYVGHVGRWDIGPRPREDSTNFNNNNNNNRNDPDRYDVDFLNYGSSSNNDFRGKEGNRFEAAMEFLDDASRQSQPFYLNLFTFAAQQPISPPDDFRREFNNLNVNENRFERSYQDEVIDEIDDRCGGDIENHLREYLAEIMAVDELIGELLDRLDRTGQADNTMVVFSSTNGPGRVQEDCDNVGSTGPYRGRKHDYHEGGTRVPFIVRWPGYVPAGLQNQYSVISALDWLPTVGGIAGANVQMGTVEGENISDILAGSNRSRMNPLFWRNIQGRNEPNMLYGRWKYYEDSRELYDLSIDMEERNNLYNRDTNVRQAMSDAIDDWERTLPNVHRRGNQDPFRFNPNDFAEIIPPPRGISP